MPYITARDGTQIHFKDWGSGRPVVFSQGWPLSADAWDAQVRFLRTRAYSVIAHVRLGLGVLGFLSAAARSPAVMARSRLVECGAIFWHLVDLLWIVLFALFYLAR